LNCKNFPGAVDSDDEEEVDITFVQVPAKVAAAVDQESLSDSSSSEESVLLDKRLRHSKRALLRKTKPQDAISPGFAFHLGEPSPLRPTEITEV
jgi:hypothetical protein